MAKLGEAWIEVRADLAKFPAALRTNLIAALKKAMAGVDFTALEDKAEDAGEESAKRVAKGFSKESKRSLLAAGKDAGEAVLEGMAGALTGSGGGGGFLGKIGQFFSGIGSGLMGLMRGGGGGDGGGDQSAFIAALKAGFEDIQELLESVLQQGVDLLGMLQSGFSSLFGGRGEQISEFLASQYERVKDLWGRLRESGREVLGNLFNEDSRLWFANLVRRGRDWINDMQQHGRRLWSNLLTHSRTFFNNLQTRGRSFFSNWADTSGRTFWSRLGNRSRSFWARTSTQVADFASRLGTQIAGAFTSATSSIGPALSSAFGQIGSAFSSIGGGLGAVLPIAGMAALIPVVVLLAGAITQLGAALFALPAAIGVVLGAVAPLVIALSGVSEAVSAGFSGDVEKFNEALKGLAPSAQKVVKELVALKPQFESIKKNVQQAFFQPIVGAFSQIGKTLLPIINKGLTQTASSLGHLARGVLDVFSRPENLVTFQKLMASTNRVVQTLEPAFANLAQAMLNLIAPALPFIEKGATAFRNFAGTVEKFTDRISGDGTLGTWLAKAGVILKNILGIAKEFGGYILNLLGGKIGDNGSEFLGDVKHEIEQINKFMKTKDGQEFINNLATGFKAVGKIITGLIAVFPYTIRFFNAIIDAIRVIGRVLEAIGAGAVLLVVTIGKFFAWLGTTIWKGLTTAADAVWDFLKGVGSAVADFFTKTIPGWWDAVVGFFTRLPGQVGNALKDFARAVWDGIVGAMEAAFHGFWRNVGRIIGIFLALPYLIETALKKIPEIAAAVWDAVWGYAVDTWNSIQSTVVGAFNAIPGLLADAGNAISGFFTALWDGIVAAVFAVPGLLADAGSAIATFFTDLWNGVVTDSYNAVVDGVNKVIDWFASIPAKIRALGPAILEAARGIGHKIAEGLSSIGNFATDLGKKVTSALKSGINAIIGSINDGIKDIDDKLPVTLPRIPKLARGAVVDKPTLAQIGEAGREVVIPLTDPGRARQLAEQSGLFEVLGRGNQQAAPIVYLTAILDGFGVLRVVDMRVDEKLNDQAQQLSYGPRGE
jgi:phage-related protein